MDITVALNAVATVWMIIRVFMWTVAAKEGVPLDTEDRLVQKVLYLNLK